MRRVEITANSKWLGVVGYFHKFGEISDGELTDLVAIIELEDGTVTSFEYDRIKFLDKPAVKSEVGS